MILQYSTFQEVIDYCFDDCHFCGLASSFSIHISASINSFRTFAHFFKDNMKLFLTEIINYISAYCNRWFSAGEGNKFLKHFDALIAGVRKVMKILLLTSFKHSCS